MHGLTDSTEDNSRESGVLNTTYKRISPSHGSEIGNAMESLAGRLAAMVEAPEPRALRYCSVILHDARTLNCAGNPIGKDKLSWHKSMEVQSAINNLVQSTWRKCEATTNPLSHCSPNQILFSPNENTQLW